MELCDLNGRMQSDNKEFLEDLLGFEFFERTTIQVLNNILKKDMILKNTTRTNVLAIN